MKKRDGFVSNSSSTSFVIIGDSPRKHLDYTGQYFNITISDIEFGFGNRNQMFTDLNSKIAFASLQADDLYEMGYSEYFEMFRRVILNHTGAKDIIGTVCGYVEDHEELIFSDDDTLADFLFSEDSYIEIYNTR